MKNISISALGINLPANQVTLADSIKLANKPNVSIEEFASCILDDPIIVLELLKRSNAMAFAESGQTITTLKGALTRLGWKTTEEILNSIQNRPQIKQSNRASWLEHHRLRAKRASIISKIIADNCAKNILEQVQIITLFATMGDMVAVPILGSAYVQLADNLPRGKLLYKLANEHGFDVDEATTAYLEKHGIPSEIYSILSRETLVNLVGKSMLRPIVLSSLEMVDLFDNGKFNNILKFNSIPPASNLRFLRTIESSHEKIVNKSLQYLQSVAISTNSIKSEEISEQSKKLDISTSLKNNYSSIRTLFALTDSAKIRQSTLKAKNLNIENSFESNETEWISSSEKKANLTNVMEVVNSSEELLTVLLDILVQNGFSNSAIIVASTTKKEGLIIASRGKTVELEKIIPLEGEGSLSVNQIREQSSKNNPPFGTEHFTTSLLQADHVTPVFLYADCEEGQTMNFEKKRLFRFLVRTANNMLPKLPGGLPVEAELKTN
jgi:hypothetical protein